MLECGVGWHSERIQITKIKLPSLLIACASGTAAKGRIRKEPAIRRNIELCPVVSADIVRRGKQPRLPAGRHPAVTAERNEKKSLDPTVPFLVYACIFRYILNNAVFAHIGIAYVGSNIFINFFCFQKRIRFIPHHFPVQTAYVRSKHNVRGLLFQKETGLHRLHFSGSGEM